MSSFGGSTGGAVEIGNATAQLQSASGWVITTATNSGGMIVSNISISGECSVYFSDGAGDDLYITGFNGKPQLPHAMGGPFNVPAGYGLYVDRTGTSFVKACYRLL